MTNRLERSMLFVPASRPRMIEKAIASRADAVCIDLEDSVAPEDKAASRANVIRALNESDFGNRLRIFRINALDTSFAYRDLIEVVEAAGARLDLVMVPKVSGPGDIVFVDKLLTQIEAHCNYGRRIGIEALIESARGFLFVREIAEASPRLQTLIVGPGDYAASLGMPSVGVGEMDASDVAYPGHRLHAMMHAVVAAARGNGLRAMDGPYGKFSDLGGLERLCGIARALGFDGKQCIHPGQVDTINGIFAPTAAEVAQAEEVLAAMGRAKGSATSLNGRMLDEANVRLARRTLERFQLAAESARENAGERKEGTAND